MIEKVLLPVDGSKNALAAVRRVAEEYRRSVGLEVYLLNVQPRLSRYVAQFVSRKNRDVYHAEQAQLAMRSAQELLERFDVPFKTFTALGARAEATAEFARRHGCARIVLGTARRNSFARLIQNSVTSALLERAHVPVQVVVGTEAPRLERFGVPAGVGAALAALFLAAD